MMIKAREHLLDLMTEAAFDYQCMCHPYLATDKYINTKPLIMRGCKREAALTLAIMSDDKVARWLMSVDEGYEVQQSYFNGEVLTFGII